MNIYKGVTIEVPNYWIPKFVPKYREYDSLGENLCEGGPLLLIKL